MKDVLLDAVSMLDAATVDTYFAAGKTRRVWKKIGVLAAMFCLCLSAVLGWVLHASRGSETPFVLPVSADEIVWYREDFDARNDEYNSYLSEDTVIMDFWGDGDAQPLYMWNGLKITSSLFVQGLYNPKIPNRAVIAMTVQGDVTTDVYEMLQGAGYCTVIMGDTVYLFASRTEMRALAKTESIGYVFDLAVREMYEQN